MLQRRQHVNDYKMPCSVGPLVGGSTLKEVMFNGDDKATIFSTDDPTEAGLELYILNRSMNVAFAAREKKKKK